MTKPPRRLGPLTIKSLTEILLSMARESAEWAGKGHEGHKGKVGILLDILGVIYSRNGLRRDQVEIIGKIKVQAFPGDYGKGREGNDQ